MFVRPHDLTDDEVARSLLDGWGIAAETISYAAVGFGSHHWNVTAGSTNWFLSVDDLDARQRSSRDSRAEVSLRLNAALAGARDLGDRGAKYTVAPVLSDTGTVIRPINERFVLAVYPHVEGRAGAWGPYDSRDDRLAVIDCLVDLHASDIPAPAQVDELAIPSRDRLEHALTQVSTQWNTGPFAEPARFLLKQHATPLSKAFEAYDRLAEIVKSRNGLVVTHGEPHRGNTIFTPNGVVLIDWDTLLAARPERDLWALIDEDPHSAEDYTQRSGSTIDHDAVRLYGLWWDLCEVSLFISDFRVEHDDSEDSKTAWNSLKRHLDPDRWLDLPIIGKAAGGAGLAP